MGAAMALPGPATYEVMGIADTDVGRHITSKAALVQQGVPASKLEESITIASESITFNTGGSPQHCRESIGMTPDLLGKAEIHVLDECPMAWSTGKIVEEKQMPFVCCPDSWHPT